MTSTAPTRPARNRQVSSRIANDDNSVGLSAAAQNLLSAKPIIDLVKKITKLTLFLPETVPLATEEDDIPRRIFELEGEDGTVASTFNRRIDILFGEHVRDSDGRLKYVRRGNLGMNCVVKYLESIHWESAKIPLDLAQGKLARIADELNYLCGGEREPTKPAGKIADPRPSFTKDAGYVKKMDVFFAASNTTTAQKKSKLKSTNETDDSEDDFDDVIEIDRPDPPAMKDTFSQLATLKLIAAPPPAKRKSEEELEGPAKKKPGTVPDEFMNRLSEQRKDDKKQTKNKNYWVCTAAGCTHRREGRRQFKDVAQHAQNCEPLRNSNDTLYREVLRYQAALALSTSVDEAIGIANQAAVNETVEDPLRGPGRPRKLETLEEGQSTLNLNRFRTAGGKKTQDEKKVWQAHADHLLMLLICKRGLVPDLLNSDDWKAFVQHVNPNLKPTPSSEFTTRIIPTEAAKVKLLTESALQKAGPSTLTFDGTQTRKDSFYTLHATTPKDEVFFLGGHFGTKTSHTAEWVKDGALRVMKAVGEDKWAAAVSDSTNTTLAARREITKAIPTVIDLCDVVHYLQHVIGDITELPEFVVMFSNVKPVIRHFNKSGKSKASLKDAGAGQGENGTDVRIHALASIGKTRFATHFMAVDTVEPALNPIRELVVQGVVKFKDPDLQELFEDPYSSAFLEFAKDLLRYKIIVRPLAQTLWSLEATTANPSDAMVFWLAAAHALDSVFAQDPAKTHISAALAGHIRAAFNGRYHQFFSHSDIYFVAFCLDPRYPIGDYLRERVVPAPEAPTHIKFSHAFLRVKAFIKTLLKGLIDQHQKHDSGCNCHPIFKRKTSLEIVRECQAQLEACWQGEAPFHAPILNDDAMEWCENLEIGYSPRSGVLAMLAVRMFGILANSMPDERTNSNITWFNSPLRGNQKAENLLDMILVGQWHTYHAEGVKVRRPRRNTTVAFRRLNPELLEKVKHKAADHSNSDSETASDSDKESDSPTVVAESVPSNTVVSGPVVGEEPSHSEDEEADRIRRRYHRKKRAAKTKGKKKVFPSHTTFVVDPDINLRSAGLKELLSDELSAPKTRASVVTGVGASSSDNVDLWESW